VAQVAKGWLRGAVLEAHFPGRQEDKRTEMADILGPTFDQRLTFE